MSYDVKSLLQVSQIKQIHWISGVAKKVTHELGRYARNASDLMDWDNEVPSFTSPWIWSESLI